MRKFAWLLCAAVLLETMQGATVSYNMALGSVNPGASNIGADAAGNLLIVGSLNFVASINPAGTVNWT